MWLIFKNIIHTKFITDQKLNYHHKAKMILLNSKKK